LESFYRKDLYGSSGKYKIYTKTVDNNVMVYTPYAPPLLPLKIKVKVKVLISRGHN
jgi:hypothetical protein